MDICRREQPYQIPVSSAAPADAAGTAAPPAASPESMDVDPAAAAAAAGPSGATSTLPAPAAGPSAAPAAAPAAPAAVAAAAGAPSGDVTCLPQRSALLKSMLNFLKKAIQDPSFSDSIRHLMEGIKTNKLDTLLFL